MTAQRYRHSIRFRGNTHPARKYQLQICEVGLNGQILYRAQWDFPTLRSLMAFLQRYFPNSQALNTTEKTRSIQFDDIPAIASQLWGGVTEAPQLGAQLGVQLAQLEWA